MKVSLLNEQITIQKATETTDSIGNRVNAWADYYTCYATIGGEESTVSAEKETAGVTVFDGKISFTVRYCSMTAPIVPEGYRVCFAGELYNITGIDHQSFKRKSLKLMCCHARRI